MKSSLCEACRRQPAKFTVFRASKHRRHGERSLCESCAKDAERIFSGNSGLLVTELLGIERSVSKIEQDRTKVCPDCGNTVDDVTEAGILGCPTCCSTFEDEIAQVVYELHGYAVSPSGPV